MLKGLANFPREEITLVVSLNIQKVCVVIWLKCRNLLWFSRGFSHNQFLMKIVAYYTDKRDKISKKHSSKKRKVGLISNIYSGEEPKYFIKNHTIVTTNYPFNYYATMNCYLTFLLVFCNHIIELVIV